MINKILLAKKEGPNNVRTNYRNLNSRNKDDVIKMYLHVVIMKEARCLYLLPILLIYKNFQVKYIALSI
ncbi:hypothetical protein PROFFT_A_02720 [Candidatus Profftia tarda]|uniref:Uncharacterized protein n=1 Tax=Candidatus Profftia tarda TaxID=1177216 RepID=A0A8E4EY75_9ENTR|nr:hypothetical protein PROFFT_A_02720 [Candidatus Profftia tarda]